MAHAKRKMTRTYTAAEVARIVGLAASTVRMHCNKGRIGTKYAIPGIDIEYYELTDKDIAWLENEENRPKGRPPKTE